MHETVEIVFPDTSKATRTSTKFWQDTFAARSFKSSSFPLPVEAIMPKPVPVTVMIAEPSERMAVVKLDTTGVSTQLNAAGTRIEREFTDITTSITVFKGA